MGTQLPHSHKGAHPQFSARICCGKMAAWIKMSLGMELGLSQGDFVLDGDPKRGRIPPPIFGPCLLWPTGWMDQDATWYGGRPRPTRHCVRCGLSYPQKRAHIPPTQFLAHVYCGQMAGWMKTPLGTEVDLGPGHIVLEGSQLPRKGHCSPSPLFLAHVYCGHGRPSQLLLSSC